MKDKLFPTNMINIDKLPPITVTKPSLPPMDEFVKEIKEIWESQWLTNMGPKHQQLQEALKEYMGVEHIDLLTNGHMSLELTLQALGIRGEVITTPFTFASTTHAIVRNGLTPVFCDINPDTYTIDVDKIESLITDRTSAILPVHVYGNICDVDRIDTIAKKYGLKVVYDAAHAFGETYKGQGIGTYGDVSCFSFHATKVYNTIEGGAVCFKNTDFGDAIARLKNFGIKDTETVDGIGANAKMNEFCAAMGLCNLRYIDDNIAKRKALVEHYIERLQGIQGIKLKNIQEDVESNYSYFPIIVDENVYGYTRNEIIEELSKNGIGARKYFYPLTNAFQCFDGKYNIDETPMALHISKRVITLPLYASLLIEDVDRICDVILEMKK